MSNAEFKRNFAALLKRVGDKADLVVRKVAIELQTSMIEKSPVDTGRFRSNWACGIGAVNTSIANQAGADAKGQTATALQGWKPGQTIYLSNSLPYARRLEFGWSQQAPSGMVRLSVQEYGQYLKKVVSELK